MEAQRLINCTTTSTSSCSMVQHGVAPVQVKLEMRAPSLCGRRSFDESLPFLLYNHISEAQFGSTVRRLNQIVTGSTVLHTTTWIFTLATWLTFLSIISLMHDLNAQLFFLCLGFMITFAIIAVICFVCDAVQRKRRAKEYMEETNQLHNTQGLHFCIEKHFRRWDLVIDILPQQSSAADYPKQQQQQKEPIVSHQQPLGFAPSSYVAGQPQPQQVAWASYSQVAYQKPSLDNV